MLSFELTEEQQQLQTTVKEFAKAQVRPVLRQLEKSGVPAALHEKFAELGLAGADYPEAAGGMALGALSRAVIEEELAFGDVGAAFALDLGGAAARLLDAVGTPAAHALLKDSLEKRWPLAFAAAEEGKAQDDFKTVASKDGAGWVLNGKKAYVFRGEEAKATLVLAQVEPGKGLAGAGLFVLRAGNAGARATKKQLTLGLNALGLHEVTLEAAKVPAADRLDAPGTLPAILRRHYDSLCVVTAARAVGLAAAATEYARAYSEERTAFGKPIGHFQAVAFLIADMATAVDAARWLTWKAAWLLDQKQPATADLAAAQAQALEAAFFCANSAVQVLGGAGYVQDHPVEKWMRDAKTLALYGQHAQASHATMLAAEFGQPLDAPELFPLPSAHPSLS